MGIDVIGDYLTEINVTSPTGIREMHRFTGITCASRLWEVVEDNLTHHYTNGPVYPNSKKNSADQLSLNLLCFQKA